MSREELSARILHRPTRSEMELWYRRSQWDRLVHPKRGHCPRYYSFFERSRYRRAMDALNRSLGTSVGTEL